VSTAPEPKSVSPEADDYLSADHGSFDGEMSTVVAQFNELQFSPDGRLVEMGMCEGQLGMIH
jgi:hypothetical protein